MRPADEAVACAREAGLRYVSDESAGVSRRRTSSGWTYFLPNGKRLSDAREIARINRLAIPPAWREVWICPHPHGHIQATGRDQRGRKQYRYHEDWRATRDATKYERMAAFGQALPRIRRRVAADLRQRGLGRDKVLAAMVRLLETTHIRVGNDQYARTNRSYGLSTLRNRHAKVRGERIEFEFTGKSGQRHEVDLSDPRLARIVAQVQELPGQEVFGYVAEDGAIVDVKSDDVNAYLRDAAGAEFSAKDFRTWAGTVLAMTTLAAEAAAPEHRPTKKILTAVVQQVAERLGNTPAVCRKCYIHPAVLDAYLAGRIGPLAREAGEPFAEPEPSLSGIERAVLSVLARQAKVPRRTLAEQLESSVRKVRRPQSAASGTTSASRGSASMSRRGRASRPWADASLPSRSHDRRVRKGASRRARRPRAARRRN